MEATNYATIEKTMKFVMELEDCPAKDVLYTAVRDVLLDYVARAALKCFLDEHPEIAEKTNPKITE